MWTIHYKTTKASPWTATLIEAIDSAQAWQAFVTYRITHGVDDYHTAEAYPL